MKNTNKHDWLEEAKKDIAEFEQTKFAKKTTGRISQSQNLSRLNTSERAKKKSSETGKKNVENGTFGTTEIALKGIEAQRESGWMHSEEMQNARSRGGITSSAMQKENGTFEKFRSAGTEAGNVIIKCKYCGFESNLRNIKKSHNEKCKQKPEDMKKVLDTMSNVFTPKQWEKALKENGFNHTQKSGYLILQSNIYTNNVEPGVYCKKLYVPSENEIKNLKATSSKASIEKLEKINKIKSILKNEFTGKDIVKAGSVFGYAEGFCRSLLLKDCLKVYEGIPGSKKDVSRYCFK